MTWLDDIHAELLHASTALRKGNAGLARTSARRAAGIALMELQRTTFGRTGRTDYITLLRDYMRDEEGENEARLAAERLQTRLRSDFSSPSTDPVMDAETVVRDVCRRIGVDYRGSSET